MNKYIRAFRNIMLVLWVIGIFAAMFTGHGEWLGGVAYAINGLLLLMFTTDMSKDSTSKLFKTNTNVPDYAAPVTRWAYEDYLSRGYKPISFDKFILSMDETDREIIAWRYTLYQEQERKNGNVVLF